MLDTYRQLPGRGGECTMEKLYYTAKEVAEMLDVSVSHAYKVIREANRELSSKGFYVRAGRVSRKYLDSKVYDLCDKTALGVCETPHAA